MCKKEHKHHCCKEKYEHHENKKTKFSDIEFKTGAYGYHKGVVKFDNGFELIITLNRSGELEDMDVRYNYGENGLSPSVFSTFPHFLAAKSNLLNKVGIMLIEQALETVSKLPAENQEEFLKKASEGVIK